MHWRVTLAVLAHGSARIEEGLHTLEFPIEQGNMQRCALENAILLVQVGRGRSTLHRWGQCLPQGLDVTVLRRTDQVLSVRCHRSCHAHLAEVVERELTLFL